VLTRPKAHEQIPKVLLSPAKLNKKNPKRKRFGRKKMPDFTNKITDGGNITAENFAEPLINVFGGNKSIGQVFQNI